MHGPVLSQIDRLGLVIRHKLPRLFYWIYSLVQPIRARRFLRRYPKLVHTPPRIVLVRGEPGPDKLWSYQSCYHVYLALRKAFDVELLVYVSFSERHLPGVLRRRPDLVSLGDDSGRFQELFERHGIPVVGSDSATCRLCYDKLAAKQQASACGVRTAEFVLVSRGDKVWPAAVPLAFPVVVKPRRGGSSVGASKVTAPTDLPGAVARAWRYDTDALVERYIAGQEYTCTVYGNEQPKTLPVYRRILTFEQAELRARGEPCPRLRYPVTSPEPFLQEIREQSVRLYQAFNCRDMIRVDWKYDTANNALYFLEINVLPWLANPGFIGEGADLIGSSYEEFIVELFRESLARQRRRAPGNAGHMPAITASANSLQRTSVAPGMSRARS